jgi:hypothetical protein
MKRLQATKDRAATLARMMQASSGIGTTSSNEGGSSGPVAVKISSNIPAGDSGLKDATLMVLDGGVLVDTKQTIKVRHVGDAAVAAGTIVTPEPCGKLGLCFAYQAGQPTPQVGIQINRRMRIVGEIAPELGTENRAWQLGIMEMWDNTYPFFGQPGHFATFDFADTTNRTTLSDGRYRWTYRLNPIRFAFDSWADNHISYGSFSYAWNTTGAGPAATRQLVWQRWDIVSALDRGEDLGVSSATLGPNSHLSDMEISGFILRPSAFVGSRTSTFYIDPPIKGPGITGIWWYSFIWDTVHKVTHYRLWINGVDTTGIVAIAGGGHVFAAYGGSDWVRPALEIQQVVTAAVRNSQSVEVDYWVSMELTSRDQFAYLAPRMGTVPAGAVTPQAIWMPSVPSAPSAIITANPAKKTTGKTWSLAFDRNGPGGLSSIELREQPGWVMTTGNNSIKLTQSSSPFDSVSLDWNREIPEITVRRPAYAISGRQAVWFFKPTATSDYAQNSIYRGPPIQYGVWDPLAATTFDIAGIMTLNNGGYGPNPTRTTKGEYSTYSIWTQDYLDGPTQITVTPI